MTSRYPILLNNMFIFNGTGFYVVRFREEIAIRTVIDITGYKINIIKSTLKLDEDDIINNSFGNVDYYFQNEFIVFQLLMSKILKLLFWVVILMLVFSSHEIF